MASRITTRLFSTARIAQKSNQNPIASAAAAAASKIKQAAQALKEDGSIGKQFTREGAIGKTIEENIGGAFSSKGSVGKQFTTDGAVGGTGQKVAEKVESAARSTERNPGQSMRNAKRTVEDMGANAKRSGQDMASGARRNAQDIGKDAQRAAEDTSAQAQRKAQDWGNNMRK
ncbi:hypothetical protein HDU85_006619 [Gaertneriomyces sp. JEL0708]|nr:hypothetical protein HDU85_006619 [Gaertneriomyces sp. JEL0708]